MESSVHHECNERPAPSNCISKLQSNVGTSIQAVVQSERFCQRHSAALCKSQRDQNASLEQIACKDFIHRRVVIRVIIAGTNGGAHGSRLCRRDIHCGGCFR